MPTIQKVTHNKLRILLNLAMPFAYFKMLIFVLTFILLKFLNLYFNNSCLVIKLILYTKLEDSDYLIVKEIVIWML